MTPPTTGPRDNLGLEEIPAAADDSSTNVTLVVEENELVLLDETGGRNPSFDIPVDVGVGDTSLCATGSEVLEDMVGAVPFEAGEAEVDVSLVLVFEPAAGVIVGIETEDVGATVARGIEDVVISDSVSAVFPKRIVGAVLDV